MPRTIITGYEDTDEGRDALALTPVLAELLDASPAVYHVLMAPGAPGAGGLPLPAGRGPIHTVIADTPAHGLHRIAEQTGALAVVLGSSHRGPIDRTLPGSTDETLLYDAPCAVAVAPRGFAAARRDGALRIAVGYDGSPAARAALDAGIAFARRSGGALTVIASVETPAEEVAAAAPLPRYERVAEQRMRDVLDDALARVPEDVRVSPRLEHGDAGSALLHASADSDLILVGARKNAPARRMFLGSASRRLFRSAACAVVAFPAP